MDLAAGQFHFSGHERRPTFPVQFLGTAAPGPRSWLWGWANPAPAPGAGAQRRCRDPLRFGERYDVPELVQAEVPFDGAADDRRRPHRVRARRGACRSRHGWRAAPGSGTTPTSAVAPGSGCCSRGCSSTPRRSPACSACPRRGHSPVHRGPGPPSSRRELGVAPRCAVGRPHADPVRRHDHESTLRRAGTPGSGTLQGTAGGDPGSDGRPGSRPARLRWRVRGLADGSVPEQVCPSPPPQPPLEARRRKPRPSPLARPPSRPCSSRPTARRRVLDPRHDRHRGLHREPAARSARATSCSTASPSRGPCTTRWPR